MAGLLYTGIAVLAAEIDHSHAGLVGLFLKIYALKERADKMVCVLADPGGFLTVISAVKTPHGYDSLMVWRHVLCDGHIPPPGKTPGVNSDPFTVTQEDLNPFRICMDRYRLVIVHVGN